MEHLYGFDLDADIKQLYGKDSKKLNKIRKEYFDEILSVQTKVRMLGSYIQNPVPCTKKEYIEFQNIKNEIRYKLDAIDDFVKTYHLEN